MSKEQQRFLFTEEPVSDPGKPSRQDRPGQSEDSLRTSIQDTVEPGEQSSAASQVEASGGGDDDEPPTPYDHLPVYERHGPLTELIDFNFLQYASYVICERAIPNIADGLKPVQRRILYALKEKDDGRFIKVANVVGHTMQYHPHGDASIGDALVTLTNKRYLIEGQGNFGNIFTGDNAAAPRYIECRLTELARNELFNKDLTHFVSSYDGRNQEPVTLPSKLPLLLMLGAEGIAVGLSTRILPHNFIELLEAEIQIIQETKKKPAPIDIMPDFQTGGVMDVSEYNQGFGRVKVRACIEKQGVNKLLITELPCMQTTESVIRSIEEAVKKKKVAVRSISDFTAEKVGIEITLSTGANQDKAIKALYAFTRCETPVTSQLTVISNKRPVEMNTEQVLRENVRQLLDILHRELALRKRNLLDDFHNKTLIQIFIENRIYKKIEECKTYEAVIKAIFKGLEPFRPKLRRDVTKNDVEMLLAVRIKRISRFDIDKNRKDIEAILKELAEVEKHLKSLKPYAVAYLKSLIRKHKKQYPRCTKIDVFKALDVRKLTSNELSINIDPEKGFLGHAVKGEPLLSCSSLDKLLIVKNDGTFMVMPPPETYYVDDSLIWCGLYKRDLVFTAVYTDWGVTYIKRFEIGGTIMNRDYKYISKDGQLQICTFGTPESIFVKYQPAKGLRIHQQEFKPEQVLIKGVKAKGIQLTSKTIARIDTKTGRWWDKKLRSPKGFLT